MKDEIVPMEISQDGGPLGGRHYETGTLRNAWALGGARAPHTGLPYSEALLLGVSGGITFGYFTFAYGGELPHLALLTRNTFDPFETILERLAAPREVRQTADPATAERQLNAALEAGETPVVWADVYSLPYYQMGPGEKMWMMRPMVVVGRAGDDYLVADGARRPWRVSAAALSAARGRVKKDRFRLMTLESPNPDKLAGAVQAGLRQCVSLFTEAPPKGAQDNFGFAAYEKWAKMLVNTKHKQSWARLFPRGPALFQALGGSLRHPGLLGWVMTWTTAEDADRRVFADFLDEAALILGKPGLKAAGERFRAAADQWHALALAALPDEAPLLKEARELMLHRRALFAEGGESVLAERTAIRERLEALREAVATEFPLSEAEVGALQLRLSEQVVEISQIEREAVKAMTAGA
jgi:hypothetical protein